MRILIAVSAMFLISIAVNPAFAQESQQPEAIAEKMAFKLVRGVANVATSFIEIPKQTYLTVRDRGAAGYVVGPIKGIGMFFFRGVIGVTEAVFFPIPQPGYYDPMIDPEYVWKGWEVKRVDPQKSMEQEPVGKKGE
jgi:putative exosortase-associated protein (TIGR04073 family)